MSETIIMSTDKSRRLNGVTLLRMQGSIDSETAHLFENQLKELLDQGAHRLLIDLAQVEYISSAGVGVFVGMLQHFREHPEGDIKACSASKKIFRVFQAIGLDSLMDFYEDEKDLSEWAGESQLIQELDHFELIGPNSQIYSGEEFFLRVVAQDANQKTVTDYQGRPKLSVSTGQIFPPQLANFREGQWKGPVIITAPYETILTIADDDHQGSVKFLVLERPKKTKFPLTINCNTCHTPIAVKSSSIYHCEVCDETFFVDNWANVMTMKPGSTAKRKKAKYKGMELKINTDKNYLKIIRQVIAGLCQQEGMHELMTNDVVLAIEEVLLNLIEHGNDYDPWQIFIIRVHFQKKQMKIQIRDYGDPFDVTKQKDTSLKSIILKSKTRGVGGLLINQLMDKIKYETRIHYNLLTMIKRYGQADD